MSIFPFRAPGPPRIGVVLGSGGLKPVSSIALLGLLERHGITPDLMVGCSGGSIVAGLSGVGNDAQQIREIYQELWTKELFKKVDYRVLLHLAGLPGGRFNHTRGLLKADKIHAAFERVFGDKKLEDFKVATILHAAELFSGQPVQLTSGLVREAVYASGSLFPMLPAIQIEDQWLVDGSYQSPLPIQTAIDAGCDVILAFTYEERTTQRSRGFGAYSMRIQGYCQHWLQRSQSALAVAGHHHEIVFINVVLDRFVGLRSVRRIPDLLAAGEKAVAVKEREILEAIGQFV